MGARITLHVDGDLSALQRELDKLKRKGLEFGKVNAKNFQQPLGKIRGELGQFDKSLAASNARVLAFGASAGAVYAVQKAFAEMIKQTIAVEKAMAEINVILGASTKELASFGNELFSIAAKTGQSFADVAEAGSELARQGLSMEQTLKRTADAMMLARLGGMDVADAVNSITAALNGFNAAGLSSTSVIDKIIAVDQAFAVSAADLAEGLKRVGNTAQDAGVGFDQLMGIITAVQQKTARGGAVIGNALKTIFTRIQRPKVLESLNELGVATTNSSGAQLDAMSIMKNLAGTYDKLAGAQKAQIAELIGGVFQVNILKASLSDLSAQYSVYGNATAVAGRASGEAEMRNASLNQTLSAGLNETMQNVAKLAATMGKLTMEPAIKNILTLINKITGVADESDAEGQGSKIGEGILAGIGKFLSGPGLMLAGVALFQLFNNLRKFAGDALRTFSGLNASFNQQKSTQQQINQLLQANPAMLKKIESGELSIQKAGETVLGLYRAQEKSLLAQERLAANVAAAMARTRGGGGGGKKGGTKLATGYVPNFEGGGEVAAMGAAGYKQGDLRNPGVRTQKVYDGQGGSFLADVNRREKTNTVVGANGHKGTFVAPPKDSVAGKKFEQRIKKQLALGYYPNFAAAAPRPAPTALLGAGGKAKRGDINNKGRGPRKGKKSVNVKVDIDDKIALISTSGGAEDMAGMVSRDFLPETLGVKIPKDVKSGVGVAKIGVRGVTSQTPGQLKDGLAKYGQGHNA
jgi:TP901 family phage tail tape measure protein